MKHRVRVNTSGWADTKVTCDGPECTVERPPQFGRSGWLVLLDDRLPHPNDFHSYRCLTAYVAANGLDL